MSEAPQVQLLLKRFFVKDVSFEAPRSPELFREEWKPDMSMEISTEHTVLSGDLFDVTLTVELTAKNSGNIAYLVEVKQAGIFQLTGLEGEPLERALHTACANTLYPYARQMLDELITKGSLPPPLLAPAMNFDALFEQRKKETAEAPEATQ